MKGRGEGSNAEKTTLKKPSLIRVKYKNIWAKIGKKNWESKKQKSLGLEIIRTLSFDEYISSLCTLERNDLF